MQSSFEDFVRIGEANVFSGLFGSLSSDSEDDAAKEVEDTLQEHGELKIGAPQIIDTNKPLRLKNKGFPGGDMYVKINVVYDKSKQVD